MDVTVEDRSRAVAGGAGAVAVAERGVRAGEAVCPPCQDRLLCPIAAAIGALACFGASLVNPLGAVAGSGLAAAWIVGAVGRRRRGAPTIGCRPTVIVSRRAGDPTRG